eukprot:scaffold2.g7142.t1
MPLYELFCLARPSLAKQALADIIKTASRSILANGGVLTDVKSFGQSPLAYDIRRPGEKYSEANMWQLTFASPTAALGDLDHLLRVDERVLRWVVLRRRSYEPLPNTYRIARAAQEVAASLNAGEAPPPEAEPAAAQQP